MSLNIRTRFLTKLLNAAEYYAVVFCFSFFNRNKKSKGRINYYLQAQKFLSKKLVELHKTICNLFGFGAFYLLYPTSGLASSYYIHLRLVVPFEEKLQRTIQE